MAPYVTPNGRFYRIDTALVVPQLSPAAWRLRVHGTGVERESSLSYDDLLAMPQVSLTRFIECGI